MDSSRSIDDKNPLAAVAEAANDYCRLIEHIKANRLEEWLKCVESALLTLDAAVRRLASQELYHAYKLAPDLDARFESYLRLKRYLDGYDELSPSSDFRTYDDLSIGSLSENLTDIYFEVRRGLASYEAGLTDEQSARRIWSDGYRNYWRQHLKEACKRLDLIHSSA
ncbi:DUF5063 domain-containing protein [Methylocaldum sp. MU1018]